MQATTKELRFHTPEIFAATDRGESVVITYRGKRRAVLTRWEPQGEPAAAEQRSPAFGLWADETEPVDEQVRRLRSRRSQP
jgi:antitoxin (DNA-binding transcriptional repressor) of toxin-antitoxin stability system